MPMKYNPPTRIMIGATAPIRMLFRVELSKLGILRLLCEPELTAKELSPSPTIGILTFASWVVLFLFDTQGS